MLINVKQKQKQNTEPTFKNCLSQGFTRGDNQTLHYTERETTVKVCLEHNAEKEFKQRKISEQVLNSKIISPYRSIAGLAYMKGLIEPQPPMN